jgi:DNA-binding MarR family transcriptional regulator
VNAAIDQLLRDYPRIYFACHARHRRDPRSRARISENQASVLDHLDAAAAIALKDLARHMGVTPATMSVVVDRLVRAGYVLRARDRRDARRVRLRLSAAGIRMKQAAQVLEPERVAALLARLSTGERADAMRGLALLARAADQEIASWTARRGRGVREGAEP